MLRKKTIFALLFFLICSFVQAGSPVRWGVVAGLNVPTYSNAKARSSVGFHAGVKSEWELSALSKGFYLDVQVLLSLKGAKYGNVWESAVYMPYYLEIPIHFGYRCVLNEKVAVFGNAGPYFAVGLFGKEKYMLENQTLYSNLFTGNGLLMERFDFGFGFQVGVELLGRWQTAIGYDWGITDIIDRGDVANRNFKWSFSYLF